MAVTLRGAARLQWEITRHRVMDFYWLVLVPVYALIFMSVFIQSGRKDLLGYALAGPLLISLGQMAFYAAGELIANDRNLGLLDMQVATPAPMFAVLATRVAVVSATGLVGFVEAWLVARLVFGVSIPIYHADVLAGTILVTAFASIGTSTLLSALFALRANGVRALQAAFTTPLYVLSGVMVPVTFLPFWLQPVSRLIFLSWSADLLRESLAPASVQNAGQRLLVIAVLGIVGLGAGAIVTNRMLDNMRRDGTISL